RVKSLQDPGKKMSKSDVVQSGCVYLLDPPEVIRKKIRSAVTDSGSEVRAAEDKPGITNLLSICSAATGKSIAELEKAFAGSQYGEFKNAVADAVIAAMEPIQETYGQIHGDKAYLDQVFKEGAEVAQKRAYKMLSKVYRKAGFAPRT
ncbi:MAG: tryptophan--tRNA ligase, partial [Elusimicrobiales bacterium]|nr:tryptophan--tRNA ligase [Elusimicrobiales bacterium]